MVNRIALALVAVCAAALLLSPFAWGQPADAGVLIDAPIATDAGVVPEVPAGILCPKDYAPAVGKDGVKRCLPAAAEHAANPASEPRVAWDDEKAAKKTSWPLAVWLALVMLGKGLAFAREKLSGLPLMGKLATWLATGRTAMVVAAVGAVGAAGYDVLIDGGTWVAALVASGAAIGGVVRSTVGKVIEQPNTPAKS